jgi:hypothetical protein
MRRPQRQFRGLIVARPQRSATVPGIGDPILVPNPHGLERVPLG